MFEIINNAKKIPLTPTSSNNSINDINYNKRCLAHYGSPLEADEGRNQLILVILVPHYETHYFNQRHFQIQFDKKKYLNLSGAELIRLSLGGSCAK